MQGKPLIQVLVEFDLLEEGEDSKLIEFLDKKMPSSLEKAVSSQAASFKR